jgi:flagellar P-ring protein precursor FlgI
MRKMLLGVSVLMLLLSGQAAVADRIKDIASVYGVRSNQLIGYGLVVGLSGTGDKTPFAEQSLKSMLSKFGIQVPAGTKTNAKNVAAVAVHAELPAFSKPGQAIDITVSSLGNAKDLSGGTLLLTQLKAVNGEVYALAQGSLLTGAMDATGGDGGRQTVSKTSVARIPNGATVEKEVPMQFGGSANLTLNLNTPDFTTASRMAAKINQEFGEGVARALDPTSVEVLSPRDSNQKVSFLATLENLEVDPAKAAAKVIVNSRTGTVVINQQVRISAAAISQGGLSLNIVDPALVATRPDENPQARMFQFDEGVSLREIVNAVNKVGASATDIVSILQGLKQAGAMRAELLVI